MTRSICIHGHFYQPPRENPWTDTVDRQPSAAPYQNWNKRIYAECYARNGRAPIIDDEGNVLRYINNYEHVSFDFGATLLRWAQRDEPRLLRLLAEADKKSVFFHEGHGNGVAQSYHHIILPLATAEEREIEIHWGLEEFEVRFGRRPKGLWLPETAVNLSTLESLADAGVEYTIVAPNQIEAIAKPKGDWTPVSQLKEGFTRRPYLVDLPSGRTMTVLVYDGDISHGIAFGGLLNDGERFAESIVNRFDESSDEEQLILVATDGESYGHHHRYGEMGLAKCIADLSERDDVVLENCEAFLARNPPVYRAKLVSPSAWSCAHGVGRWERDCGCAINPGSGWNQAWRGPLRGALEWLRDKLHLEVQASKLKLKENLKAAQLDYVKVIINQWTKEQFAQKHVTSEQAELLLGVMEMFRFSRAMFTSCAWFFDDVSGIESKQNLLYARRALELAKEHLGVDLEPSLVSKLKLSASNLKEIANGANVYQRAIEEALAAPGPNEFRAKAVAHPGEHFENRTAGVLLHPTSLPGPYGIGTIGPEAFRFVDWLADTGFTWWQVLPLVPPEAGGSPYSSWSTFAANVLLVELAGLYEQGLLDTPPPRTDNTGQVDFAAVNAQKWPLLQQAASALLSKPEHPWFAKMKSFRNSSDWIEDAGLYYALRKKFDGKAWWDWPEKLRTFNAKAVAAARKELAEDIDQFVAMQYFFERQWTALRQYCKHKGVKIMGDIPIYVGHDSADVWANQGLFLLDKNGQCLELAGAPPDAYSETGQLWGNPIYRWDVMQARGFRWWKNRIARAMEQVDVVRLDHFRGFAAYWSVPAGSENALTGRWVPGPGAAFFEEIQRQWPKLPFVAEDLGLIDEPVETLRDQFSLKGMRVLQFGFDGDPSNIHAVHNVIPESVVYTGTHDSDTLLGWWLNESDWLKDQVRRYFAIDGHDLVWDMIRACFGSSGQLAMVQMQDLLALDSSGRMNRPGIAAGNWGWRLKQEAHEFGVTDRTKGLIWMYGRQKR